MIRVGIVEDNPMLAQELKTKIELSSDFKVLLNVRNGQEALDSLMSEFNIDVILMDIEMPVINGIETTSQITREHPDFPIIICSIYDDETSIMDSIFAGATGYLLKDESPENIHHAIKQALNGGSPLNPIIAKKTLRLLHNQKQKPTVLEEYGLTPREIETLELLATGKSYSQIADELFVSTGTIRKHIENLYRKLNVTNKVDAIRKL